MPYICSKKCFDLSKYALSRAMSINDSQFIISLSFFKAALTLDIFCFLLVSRSVASLNKAVIFAVFLYSSTEISPYVYVSRIVPLGTTATSTESTAYANESAIICPRFDSSCFEYNSSKLLNSISFCARTQSLV